MTAANMIYSTSAGARAVTQRIGLWIKVGDIYSGGRIAMTMYAIGLARAGAEVWFITDGEMPWRNDYEFPENMHRVRLGEDPYPEDLDLLVTDCRGAVAEACVAFKLAHPDVPLVVVAFETPNWARRFDERLGCIMDGEDFRAIEQHANFLMAISHEGAKYLAEFYADGKPIEVIYPAINTEVLDQAQPHRAERPYCVISARPTRHKHIEVALRAVFALPFPMDVYIIGGIRAFHVQMNANHKVFIKRGISDAEKFALMKGAALVLAPSTFEGFGLVPGESILCQTPAVAYDLPVLREAYGNDVVYAAHNDERDFVAAVRDQVAAGKVDMSAAAARTRAKYGLENLPERLERAPYHAVRRTRLSAAMICYATPPCVVEACLASLYDVADEINLAYGPVPYWVSFPEGGTLDAIRSFPDPQHKLRIEARPVWPDKREMWQWCGAVQTGNFQLVTGADMVWVGLDKWLSAGVKWASPRWVNFWHDINHWIYGPADKPGRWGERLEPYGSLCRHRLFGWWRHSYRFDVHTEPVDFDGHRLWSVEENRRAALAVPECVCYHLGHLLPPAVMDRKHSYYTIRDGHAAHGDYWREWGGGVGPCGDGIVADVDWQLPAEVLYSGSGGHWQFGDDYGHTMKPARIN